MHFVKEKCIYCKNTFSPINYGNAAYQNMFVNKLDKVGNSPVNMSIDQASGQYWF